MPSSSAQTRTGLVLSKYHIRKRGKTWSTWPTMTFLARTGIFLWWLDWTLSTKIPNRLLSVWRWQYKDEPDGQKYPVAARTVVDQVRFLFISLMLWLTSFLGISRWSWKPNDRSRSRPRAWVEGLLNPRLVENCETITHRIYVSSLRHKR